MTARRRSRPVRRPAPATAKAAPAAARAPRPSAEMLLLDLARALTARSAETTDFPALVEASAAAYAPDAPLALALREDWRRRQDDKTAGLALAWAREQVRLALVEILQRSRPARTVRGDVDVDTLAWLWLAACEALAHEPAGAVPDRVHALTTFLTTG